MRFAARLGLVFATFALGSLASPDARAKDEFVDDLAAHLQLTYVPPCRLCHIAGTTGPGSVQTPFGVSMLAHGLTESRATLLPAVDGLAADAFDSDGDGVSDVAELRADTDPNTPVDVPLDASAPTHGCAAGGPGRTRLPASAAFATVAALLARRRRARREPPGVHRTAVGPGRFPGRERHPTIS